MLTVQSEAHKVQDIPMILFIYTQYVCKGQNTPNTYSYPSVPNVACKGWDTSHTCSIYLYSVSALRSKHTKHMFLPICILWVLWGQNTPNTCSRLSVPSVACKGWHTSNTCFYLSVRSETCKSGDTPNTYSNRTTIPNEVISLWSDVFVTNEVISLWDDLSVINKLLYQYPMR